MINSVKIELLKSKRTHTFPFVILIMAVATIWQLLVFKTNFSHSSLKGISTLYSNQTVDCLFLPILVSIFSSKIVSNEKEGQTFKLQQANGKRITNIFRQKYLLMISFFIVMFVFEILVRYFFANLFALRTSLNIIFIYYLGQLLTISILISFFLLISLLLNKQGIVLSFGFLIGFFCMIMSSQSQSLLSFWVPGIGSAYLAPFKYKILSSSSSQISFKYVADDLLLLRFVIYSFYSVVIYFVNEHILSKKQGGLL